MHRYVHGAALASVAVALLVVCVGATDDGGATAAEPAPAASERAPAEPGPAAADTPGTAPEGQNEASQESAAAGENTQMPAQQTAPEPAPGEGAAPQQTPAGGVTTPGLEVGLGEKGAASGPAQGEQQAATPRRREGGLQGLLRRLELFQGVTITGSNTFTLQEHRIEGSQTAFETQRWDTDRLLRQTSVHLQGPVWRELAFQADISDSGWGPRYSRWLAGFVGHDTWLLYGDIDMRLGGNEFVGFQKSTRGWQLDQKLPGGGLLRGFFTREKGITRNQTFVGNDTPGPYFLTFTPIIEGSEAVKVNEERLTFGKDYRLDYDTGQLWFEPVDGPPRVISASDTISVSYQSLGYLDQGPGEIYGARAEIPLLNDRLLLGITALEQNRAGRGGLTDTVGYQEDIYNGSGSTGPFDTNFRPIIADGASVVYKGKRQVIDRALKVLVDGAEQLEGVDYDAYRAIGRIIFRRAVPPTALVIVKYYYDVRRDQPTGDKGVWGLDASYRLGRGMNLALDWARSSTGSTAGDGTAFATSLDYSRKNLRMLAEYRDVEPTFNYMDTVGFRRRERGLNLGGQWDVNQHISIFNRYSKADSDSGLSYGYSGYGGGYNFGSGLDTLAASIRAAQTSGPSLAVQTERNELGLRLNFDGWPRLGYQRSTMSNVGGSTGSSDYATDNLSLDWAPSGGRYSVRTSYNRSRQSNVPPASGTGAAVARKGSDTNRFQTSVTLNPSQALSLAASFAKNTSSALESATRSSSRNIQFSARWSPSMSLSLQLDHTESRTDGRVTSGYFDSYPISSATPGTGTGLPTSPGGGGSGGEGGQSGGGTVRPSSHDSNDRMSLSWRVTDDLSLDLGVGRRKYTSTGSQGYLADSDQLFWNLGAMWQVNDALSLNLSLGSDRMKFLDADRGAVNNRSFILGIGYRPPGKRWSSGLTFNLQDGSSPTYVGYGRLQRYKMVGTKLFDVSAQFSYDITRDFTLLASTGLSDFAGGYADFRKTNAELRVRYKLNSTTGLDFGYRFIRNISAQGDDSLLFGTTSAGQSYVANTFMLALSTNFSGGIGEAEHGPFGTRFGGLASFGGGPGTFGGFQPGLHYGQYGTGSYYGTGYGGPYGIGARSGLGTGARIGGYSPTPFDTLGTQRLQPGQTGIFGPGGPWSSETYVPRAPASEGSLDKGMGSFRRDDRTGEGFGSELGTSGLGPRPQPAGGSVRETRPAPGEIEDWWLLGDGRAYW